MLRGVASKRRDLDDLAAREQHVCQPKAPPDDAAIAKEVADLIWACAGRDVEVLGLAAEHQVAHPTPNQVRRVPVAVETTDHLRSVWVHQTSRDLVGVDDGLRGIFGELFSLVITPLTEVGIYHSGHRIPKGPEKRRAVKLSRFFSNMRA